MTDRRELILARLFAILQTIPSVQAVVRNRGELPDDKRPGIILFDAGEVARLQPPQQARGRLIRAATFVDMTPQIFVVMDQREPPNKNLGQDMNALRITIVRTIIYDPELETIIGGNGDIRYAGTTTDLTGDGSAEGQMNIRLTFTYVLKPSEL